MKLYRKSFSEKKENLENKGIATGSVLTGIGTGSYLIGKKIEKIGPSFNKMSGEVVASNVDPRHLKRAGKVLVPVGASLAISSAGYKYYKKKKGKKDNDNKA